MLHRCGSLSNSLSLSISACPQCRKLARLVVKLGSSPRSGNLSAWVGISLPVLLRGGTSAAHRMNGTLSPSEREGLFLVGRAAASFASPLSRDNLRHSGDAFNPCARMVLSDKSKVNEWIDVHTACLGRQLVPKVM